MVKTMGFTKTTATKSALAFVFLFLLLLPFGQIARVKLNIVGGLADVNIVDIVVLATVPLYFYVRLFKKPGYGEHILSFIFAASFSFLLSIFNFGFGEVLKGGFYLVRIFSYYAFFVCTNFLFSEKKRLAKTIEKAVIVSLLFAAVLGWMQYFLYPDLTSLRHVGWDDHMYRLAGTFLDPTFTGIIFVFGSLLSIKLYFSEKQKSFLFLFLVFSLSIIFTYARAVYIAYAVGVLTFWYFHFKNKKFFWVLFLLFTTFLAAFILLPRRAGEGTNLVRTSTVFARINNYKETLEIIKEHPLFGVGFNNLCLVRMKLFDVNFDSNACSGADMNVLFVWATMGIVGLMVFISSIYKIVRDLITRPSNAFMLACFTAVFVHSLFVQSAFYSHVMGLVVIFYSGAVIDE